MKPPTTARRPLDRDALRAAVSAALADVQAVLDDRHEVERHGGRRVFVGLEYIDDDGLRAELPYQPQTRRPSCRKHGQDLCSQCGTRGWLQASRTMPHTSPAERTAIANLCPPAALRVGEVRAVLADLPDADVALAWMKAAGLTGIEAAAALGIRPGATRQRWTTLRKKLRARLAPDTNGHISRGVCALPAAA